jgi:hypothetical protein
MSTPGYWVPNFDPSQLAALGEYRALFAAREVIERAERFGKVGTACRTQCHRPLGAMKEPHAEQPFRFLDQLG